jgi:hypothetical protein
MSEAARDRRPVRVQRTHDEDELLGSVLIAVDLII